MARTKRFSFALTAFLVIICLLIGFAAGWYYQNTNRLAPKSDVFIAGGLSIHFLELGNAKTGDCMLIQSGTVDILVDAGSHRSSIETIANYLQEYVKDDVIEYAIVTHAHEDHYAGFATSKNVDSLFDLFDFGTIIDFAMTNHDESGLYANYLRERAEEIADGAVHYTAQDCIDQNKTKFDLSGGVELQILDSYYYDHEDSGGENNYSVCFMLNQDERHFLFTGDLEEEGEEKLIEMNDLPKMTLYKAAHHGSNTSNSAALMEVIQPEIVCIPCCAGSSQYSPNPSGQFPTQKTINNIAPYTDRVYVTSLCNDYDTDDFTSMNGNIVVTSDANGVQVVGSNNSTILRETAWFAQNRTLPNAWKNKAA